MGELPLTLSFPLADLADLLPIAAMAWNEARQDAISALGSGEWLTHELGPQLHEAEVRTARLPHARAEQLRARLRAVDGGAHFYLSNPTMLYPQADPGGAILATASVVIASINAARKDLALSGLPAGYVITMGDYLHIDYGTPSRRALLQAAEGATANGSGFTPEFEVRPQLRPGITAGLAVTLKKPAAKVKIVPGSVRIETVTTLLSQIRFTARQTLAAG
jgi:hypothetical protein